jgi:hypothetical protein
MVNHMREPIFARWFACCRSVRWQQDGDKRPLTIQQMFGHIDASNPFMPEQPRPRQPNKYLPSWIAIYALLLIILVAVLRFSGVL